MTSRQVTYTLSSGVKIDLRFDTDGSFQDEVWVHQRKLTAGDVEEIYQHVNDAEMYGLSDAEWVEESEDREDEDDE